MPRERRPPGKLRAETTETSEPGNRSDGPATPSSQPASPSKRKRKSQQSAQNSPSIPDLVPPPPSDKGETIVAGNPFDDVPGQQLVPQLAPQGLGLPPFSHQQQQQQLQQQQLLYQQRAGHFYPRSGMHNKHPGPPMPPPMAPGSGKVYPPNQPMVFNPSNPNAPPIYPCGICHKEVHDNDQAILCESGCNFWFHRICTGLTEAAYHMLTQEVYAEWVCDKCLSTKSIPVVKMKP